MEKMRQKLCVCLEFEHECIEVCLVCLEEYAAHVSILWIPFDFHCLPGYLVMSSDNLIL